MNKILKKSSIFRQHGQNSQKKILHLQTTRTKFSKKNPPSSDNTNKILKKNPPSSDNTNKILKKNPPSSDNTNKILKKILHLQTSRTKFSKNLHLQNTNKIFKKSSIFRQHEKNNQKNPPFLDDTNKINLRIQMEETSEEKSKRLGRH